ncbi:hypothetical protein C1645_821067 [Glomus cerebriforme]|uniref:Uncharacterized protein n=1 Tax=Glomus cerebriforme TaxID=658196 RepID=A0A397T123_9GLOM|nr:hypothetical protein C1645_821067 [Glomus cerebriforme]
MKNNAELYLDIKKIMKMIVGLLKNRVEVDDSPDNIENHGKLLENKKMGGSSFEESIVIPDSIIA